MASPTTRPTAAAATFCCASACHMRTHQATGIQTWPPGGAMCKSRKSGQFRASASPGHKVLPEAMTPPKEPTMLAVIAAVLFAVAFVINAAGIATDAVFAPLSLTFAGLACLAFHLTGIGPGLPAYRRGRGRRR
jgi:hypothetical protein